MKQMLMGFLMMLTGLFLLFAMVLDSFEAGLFSSLGAYSLVMVGLMLSCFGLAAVVQRPR